MIKKLTRPVGGVRRLVNDRNVTACRANTIETNTLVKANGSHPT